MKKRTDIDFSSYEVKKIEFPELLIHHIARPNTRIGEVKFINTQGIMVVTGDYGNWVFCREFHPSKDGFVSDGYWCEKLQISSTQKPYEYDADRTEEEIIKRLGELETDNDDEREYLEDLLNQVHECEERYMIYAYDNLPENYDHEYIPHIKKLNPWLECIFDAFEEICKRETE